ncbi:hypothetical protein SAMN02745218_02969 [Desulfofundulus australicus DSM 11792]|uniref:MPN635 N-terminal domain-containing protein n=1 Tax=Desulfofundulus australicus DSM 11792 TaxID=1121425 RepID=A0A1M5E1M1_9FIRM|nr:hypothetical protein SAMN02745218_02969 [Desulfofundulus australicus DSM 11792]
MERAGVIPVRPFLIMFEQLKLFQERIKTNISSEYVKSWGVVEALREIVQENLDARKKYSCRGRVFWKKGFLIAEDNGPGLRRQDLALGNSGKRGHGELIGQFGEGLKLAALVAAREERKMYIETAGFTAVPVLEYEPALECQVLVFVLEENDRVTGTRICFEATREESDAALGLFLEFSTVRKISDRIYLPGGRVYVNGALAAERKDMLFSYDLTGENIRAAQNRDRTVVDDDALLEEVGRVLSTCRNPKVIVTLFRIVEKKEAKAYLEGRAHLEPPNDNLAVWRKAMREVFGARVCLASDAVYDLEAREKGFVVLNSVPWQWEGCFRRLGAKFSYDIAARARKPRGRVALKDLSREESRNLRWAKKIAREVFGGKLPKIMIVSEIPPDGEERVRGCYDHRGVIYLLRDVLTVPEEVLGTLVHEMVHHVTDAPDCTRGFERGWQEVVVKVLLRMYGLPEVEKTA